MNSSSTPIRNNVAHLLLKMKGNETKLESINETSNKTNENDGNLGCNCKKSKCLKLYCACFAAKIVCEPNCNCVGCANTSNNLNERQDAMKLILERNPSAFDSKFKTDTTAVHKIGCHCRKSQCLKKYCECFHAGIFCNAICTCVHCANDGSGRTPTAFTNKNKPTVDSSAEKEYIQPTILSPQDNEESIHLAAKALLSAKVEGSSRNNNNNNNNNNRNKTTRNQVPRPPAPAAGTGEHLLKLKERTAGSSAMESPVGEFDFESALTSFKKDEVLAEVASENTILAGCYIKDNFFDTLSSSVDPENARKDRLTPNEERVLNQDTFGAIALQQNTHRRHGNNNNNNSNQHGHGHGHNHGGRGGRGNNGRGGYHQRGRGYRGGGGHNSGHNSGNNSNNNNNNNNNGGGGYYTRRGRGGRNQSRDQT
mmetsp:Transcript_5626/g.5791  ORF Transcript_5626/g.5791 Transcript_5626/m.5791 type:complete len:424 (+) Transcript_5626:32-1303(+)